MQCPCCEHDSKSSERFCIKCGTRLAIVCVRCGTDLPDEAQFCGSCGAPVDNGAVVTQLDRQPPAVPMPSVPTSFQKGRYELRRFLGEGAAKRVYLTRDTLLGRDVAFALVKTTGLDQTGRQRFLREARTMGRLSEHPNIVQLYDLGAENEQLYMVLPVMTGGDIESLIRSAPNNRLDPMQAIGIAMDACRGLGFAHARGVVHRDMKPSNIWLAADGTAKIGDFGLAIAMDNSQLTQNGKIVGTLLYMAPEQATGARVNERSDLYSLGCVLYKMITGRHPFLGDTAIAILGQHINTPPVAPTWHNPNCPKSLETVILELLMKDPVQRPQSSEDVLRALEAVDARVETAISPPLPSSNGHSPDSSAGDLFVGR